MNSRLFALICLLAMVVMFVVLCFGGCSNLDDYDRSYSLRYADGDESIGASMTLHPRKPYADALRVPLPRPTPSLDWKNPDFYPDFATP
ncbi:MAG TPA: hypothetical protein VIM61_00650 [Chthoniobacterales bacterium]